MNGITKKLHDKHMNDFRPFAEQLAAEGADEDKIVRAYHAWLKGKKQTYYAHVAGKMEPLSSVVGSFLKNRGPGSKAEVILYQMLEDAKINFQFQYGIGPYTADFLIAGFLVLEIDGPQHDEKKDAVRDRYMRKMGYKVLRIPIHILCACPEAVIDEIREAVKIRRVK